MTASDMEAIFLPKTFSVEIPVPPSLNHAYANAPGKGRVKTKSTTAWKRTTAWLIRSRIPASRTISGAIHVRLELPRKMRGDADNRIKLALDALVMSGRIDDDRHVDEIWCGRVLDRSDCAVLTVTAVPVLGQKAAA